jgi:hypothetical protein
MSEPQLSAAALANPLSQAGILQHVLNYLGPGHWLFAALVAKAWHQAYQQVPEHRMTGGEVNARMPVVCVPQMTLYSAAVASSARLRLAHRAGLELSSSNLQFAVGKWGCNIIDLLRVAAREHIRWSGPLLIFSALQHRHLSTLQWLVQNISCPLPDDAPDIAAACGCADTLAWLK